MKNLINKIENTKVNLCENDILNFLQIQKRWPIQYPSSQATIQIINQLGFPNADFFENTRDGVFLNYEKWLYFYNLGFTSIISNVLDLTKELRLLQKTLVDEIGLKICGNFYFGKPGRKASFNKHSHSYDVIVKQIYGKSKWILDNQEIYLYPNQVLYVPKGTEHAVIEKTEKKLSLTLNIE
jgi:hypothetical protein